MKRSATTWLAHAGLAAFAFGCVNCSLLSGARVDAVATSAQKPSNVAVYVSVKERSRPVDGLLSGNFAVFENEQAVPNEQSQLTLLDREVAVLHHTLLLIDMSGARDETVRADTARAAAGFVGNVRRKQSVTVYAFDGSAEPRLVGEYPKSSSGSAELGELQQFSVADPSRNLHGAIVSGLSQLEARLMQQPKPVRIGTLVVFTRGPDVAGRLNQAELADVLDKTPHHVLAVGVGKTDGDYYLENIGRAGVVRSQDATTVGIALEDAAARVEGLYDMYYLVSYCSPARAGMRRMRLEVTFTNKKGDEKRGSVEREFDASGFGPGCDPQTPPRFVMTQAASAHGVGSEAQSAPAENKPAPSAPSGAPRARKGSPGEPSSEGDGIVPPPEQPRYTPENK